MAYMDGQLSASEALEFERSLSPQDQKRLADEMKLETAICETIGGEECCPKALWNNLKLQMKNQTPGVVRARRWQQRFVGLAASIAIVVTSAVVYNQLRPEDANTVAASSFDIVETDLSDFARHTEVSGSTEATQQFLREHGVRLRMVSLEAAGLDPHHPVRLLGACMGTCPKGSIIELRLSCCDRPVKLLIIKKGKGTEGVVRSKSRCGKVKVYRETSETFTALVGDIHGHSDLLNLLQPEEEKNVV